jgi:UDP-2,3-diacylglucosamine pyrophosphatase LpxH
MVQAHPPTETPAGKRFAVVLSDIHIGDNTPTCWYQSAVHDPQLGTLIAWILARRDTIREVVLLGDLFDLWTYPPSVRPPSLGRIIARNPVMLGPRGPFAALVRALPNRVRLLLGNHDHGLRQVDIDQLNRSLGGNPSAGERIQLVESTFRVLNGASGARTVLSHGHHWTMFNAPDPRSTWRGLPVGHFVTRAIGYQLSRSLRPGETAADRRNSGNPMGVNLLAALASWNRRDDLAAYLLSYICRHTGMSETAPVVMADRSTTTMRHAMRVYAGLFTEWVRREGRAANALRAAAADWRGTDLAWFAQRLALQTASDLAVMGHTHSAVRGLVVSPINYVNSGYECVSRPDAAHGTPFSFAVIDLERARAQLMAVVRGAGGFTVAPFRAPLMDSVIPRPFFDFSCYARIENRSDRPLRLVRSAKSASSYWVIPPPAIIAPRTRANIWLQDTVGTRGSAGSFTYSDGTRALDFALECPTGFASNVVRSPVANYETRTEDRPWRRGGVDRTGHPVQARFYIGAPVPAGVGPASTGPGRANGRPGAPPRSGARPGARSRESRFVVATRAILDRARTPRERGVVMCVADLTSNDGRPLLDPATQRSGTREQLANPPNHLVSPEVHSITLPDRSTYRYVWIQPKEPPTGPPLVGGVAFLPDPGADKFTLVTFNIAGLDNDYRRRCTNRHHAEMQLVGFVDAQPVAWRTRVARLELHNRSRKGLTWGYSACNACLHDLAEFLTRLNNVPRRQRVKASISWERLYDKNPRCGHPTDAANIRRLVSAGWDEPQGPRPAGTRWPTDPELAPLGPDVLTR